MPPPSPTPTTPSSPPPAPHRRRCACPSSSRAALYRSAPASGAARWPRHSPRCSTSFRRSLRRRSCGRCARGRSPASRCSRSRGTREVRPFTARAVNRRVAAPSPEGRGAGAAAAPQGLHRLAVPLQHGQHGLVLPRARPPQVRGVRARPRPRPRSVASAFRLEGSPLSVGARSTARLAPTGRRRARPLLHLTSAPHLDA